MGVCSVLGCKSRSKERRMPHRTPEGVTFHAFPTKNQELRARWCLAVRGVGWTPNKHAKVCSKHFRDHFIDRTGQTCRLKENAMPTLGLDPRNLALAHAIPKSEHMEPHSMDRDEIADPLSNPSNTQHSSDFVSVVAEAVLNVGRYQYQTLGEGASASTYHYDKHDSVPTSHRCESHEEILSPHECNKLMYSLDLGDGRKIKLVLSVPKGQCLNVF